MTTLLSLLALTLINVCLILYSFVEVKRLYKVKSEIKYGKFWLCVNVLFCILFSLSAVRHSSALFKELAGPQDQVEAL